MLMLQVLLGVIIYIAICFLIGHIKFSENAKKYTLGALSIIYNAFWGYADTITALLLYGYFANLPKGSGYEVPESEAGFNAMLGIITFLMYVLLLIPINIYIQKKSKINRKVYVIINILATIVGFSVYWIFLDKSKRLF